MGPGPDQLPLMQHALTRLWKESIPRPDGMTLLTSLSYEAMGGLEGAVCRQADALYESLDHKQRRIQGAQRTARTQSVLARGSGRCRMRVVQP